MIPIIIVDDSQEDLLLTMRVVREMGFVNPLHSFRGPVELLSYFMGAPAETEPALIFLDLVMFPVSGIETLGLLKQFPVAERSVKVVLTGLGDVRQIQPAYKAGATTFLLKPVNRHDIQSFLSAFKKHFVVEGAAREKVLKWALPQNSDVRGQQTEPKPGDATRQSAFERD